MVIMNSFCTAQSKYTSSPLSYVKRYKGLCSHSITNHLNTDVWFCVPLKILDAVNAYKRENLYLGQEHIIVPYNKITTN